MGSRVDLFEQIRRDRDREGVSIRALAERYRVHRRTVRAALESPLPPPRKRPEGRPAPVLGPLRALIDEWLEADRAAPRKQRHTARRIWRRLIDARFPLVKRLEDFVFADNPKSPRPRSPRSPRAPGSTTARAIIFVGESGSVKTHCENACCQLGAARGWPSAMADLTQRIIDPSVCAAVSSPWRCRSVVVGVGLVVAPLA